MRPTTYASALALGFGLLSTAAMAADQEVILFNWLGGAEKEMFDALEAGFEAQNPDIDVKQINPAADGDDSRAGIRTALLAGEVFDILINTWPSFEKELVDNSLLRPLNDAWAEHDWSAALSDSWRNLSTHNGETFGAYVIAGNRSGLWYRTDNLGDRGLEPPASWEDFLASFEAFRADDKVPVYIGARSWAQTEWFENALLKTAGTDFAGKLAAHEASWEDEQVKKTLHTLRAMLEANCCADPDTMLSTHWSDGADSAIKDAASGYLLIGTWMNARAANDYGLTPGDDYSFVNFPTIDPAHEKALSVDGKNLVVMQNGENPDQAVLFIDYVLSAEGARIIS
ncbi:MAG: ABC transporter substrate-binding protein, partial [Geminicoccaceae bacterium]